MDLIKTCELGKWIREEDINGMQRLAVEAKEKQAKLKITRG
jgi:hypothetical protein